MTDIDAAHPGEPGEARGVPADGSPAELARLAYLLVGDHVAARAALAEALAGDTARGDGAVLEVVRQSLAREGLVDRSRDDDFWRGGAWALQKLAPDQRVLVALSVGLRMSEADVAGLLDTPERTVRRRLLAGRAALAAQLGLDREDATAVDAAVLQIADRHQPAPGPADGPARPGPAALPSTAEVGIAGPAGPRRVRRGVWVGAAGAAAALAVVLVLAWPAGRDGVSLVAAPTPTPTATGAASTPALGTTAPPPVTPTAEPTASAAAPRTSSRRSSTRTTSRPTTRTTTRSTRTTTRPGATTRTTRTPKTTTTTTRTRTPTPTGTPVPRGLVRGAASGLCLDAGSGSPGWGTQVRLAECAGGPPQVVGSAGPETVTIAGLCLDGFGWGTSPGTAVVLWDCHGGNNQKWTAAPNGALRSVHAGLCIATNGSGVGAALVLAGCDGSAAQSWQRT